MRFIITKTNEMNHNKDLYFVIDTKYNICFNTINPLNPNPYYLKIELPLNNKELNNYTILINYKKIKKIGFTSLPEDNIIYNTNSLDDIINDFNNLAYIEISIHYKYGRTSFFTIFQKTKTEKHNIDNYNSILINDNKTEKLYGIDALYINECKNTYKRHTNQIIHEIRICELSKLKKETNKIFNKYSRMIADLYDRISLLK
jgi:hypothetical protein